MNNLKPYNIKLDSHVHFYDCWKIPLEHILTTAHNRLSINTGDETSHNTLPAICLLDTEKDSTSIKQNCNMLTQGEWKKEAVELEPYSFWFKKQDKIILVITGTQINTAEGLEVLVIGNKGDAKHGMPITEILEQQQDGLLNIVPWGVGKWLSKRGAILTQLLENMDHHQFVLGDNGGRPWLWKNIRQLEYARTHNIPILCGSDPLPLHKHYLKSGSYGNLIETNLDMEKPWTSILQAINNQHRLKQFGQLSSISNFIVNQLKLRL